MLFLTYLFFETFFIHIIHFKNTFCLLLFYHIFCWFFRNSLSSSPFSEGYFFSSHLFDLKSPILPLKHDTVLLNTYTSIHKILRDAFWMVDIFATRGKVSFKQQCCFMKICTSFSKYVQVSVFLTQTHIRNVQNKSRIIYKSWKQSIDLRSMQNTCPRIERNLKSNRRIFSRKIFSLQLFRRCTFSLFFLVCLIKT